MWAFADLEEPTEAGQVQVVDYTSSANSAALSSMTKREMKAFMVRTPFLPYGIMGK